MSDSHLKQLTTTQREIVRILADGERHEREDLTGTIVTDSENKLRSLSTHLSKMRKVLRPAGLDIICELFEQRIHYRLVRLVGRANDSNLGG